MLVPECGRRGPAWWSSEPRSIHLLPMCRTVHRRQDWRQSRPGGPLYRMSRGRGADHRFRYLVQRSGYLMGLVFRVCAGGGSVDGLPVGVEALVEKPGALQVQTSRVRFGCRPERQRAPREVMIY